LASVSFNTFMKAILSVFTIAVVICTVYLLLKGAIWKELVRPILFMAVLTVVIIGILFALTNIQVTSDLPQGEVLPPPVENIGGPALGPLPPFLIWLVWIGLAGMIILLGIWWINRQIQLARAGDAVELEAERAMQALKSGLSLQNVIVRCYRQMSLALQREQGIELEETMTARDFECLLEAKGIPATPVHQLTQLFEVARYGHRPPRPGDEQKAFDCLSAIVQYSRAKRRSA
jgi:hypothetical protein